MVDEFEGLAWMRSIELDGMRERGELFLLQKDEHSIPKKSEVSAEVWIFTSGFIFLEAMIFDPMVTIFNTSPMSSDDFRKFGCFRRV